MKFPLHVERDHTGVWIETADRLVVAKMNDLLGNDDELVEVAELLVSGANQLHERENPSAPWTDALRKQIKGENP
jgi:hypothetical protein